MNCRRFNSRVNYSPGERAAKMPTQHSPASPGSAVGLVDPCVVASRSCSLSLDGTYYRWLLNDGTEFKTVCSAPRRDDRSRTKSKVFDPINADDVRITCAPNGKELEWLRKYQFFDVRKPMFPDSFHNRGC